MPRVIAPPHESARSIVLDFGKYAGRSMYDLAGFPRGRSYLGWLTREASWALRRQAADTLAGRPVGAADASGVNLDAASDLIGTAPVAETDAVRQRATTEPVTPDDTASLVSAIRRVAAGAASAVSEAQVRAIVDKATAGAVSEAKVRAMVDRAVADAVRVEEVHLTRQDGTTVTRDGEHYLFPRLLRLINAGLHVYLWGPPGTGKTTAALHAAEALGRTAEIDTLDPSTFRSMIQGYRSPAGEPMHTAFSRCWELGRVYVADEADNAPGHVQTLFNSALANGHAPLAWGQVARADGFAFIGTGNTPGRPTRHFPDRRPMSGAFLDRLYFLHWPLDPAIECRAGGLPVSAAPRRKEGECTAAKWVQWVQAVRQWADTNAPTLSVTPRASLDGLRALEAGETPAEVADGVVFRGADAELVAKALHAVPLP